MRAFAVGALRDKLKSFYCGDRMLVAMSYIVVSCACNVIKRPVRNELLRARGYAQKMCLDVRIQLAD